MTKTKFVKILRNLDRNWDGLSYDVIRDMVEVLRKNGEIKPANFMEQKMIEIVGNNLFNHEQTYNDLWALCHFMSHGEYKIVSQTFVQTLENLDEKGLAGTAELN